MNRVSSFYMAMIVLSFSWMLSGCRCSKDSNTPLSTSLSPEQQLVARGKLVYNSNCISCHNPNPKFAGSLGPDVYGSSRELLEARILRAGYPDGYKPKRQSHLMPALPQLANDIDALVAFLNQK